MTSTMTNLSWDNNKQSAMALLVMTVFGIGEIIGSFAAGYVLDKYS
jgi:predicted MFS family arabinose efflux permease